MLSVKERVLDCVKNEEFIRWLSTCVACVAMLVPGSVMAFNAYFITLQQTFNYTVTDMQWLASLHLISYKFEIPASLVYEYFGPAITVICGCALATTGFLLLWHTTTVVYFFRHKPWLMALYLALTGFGLSFGRLASVVTTCGNQRTRHRGRVIGTLEGFESLGTILSAALFGLMHWHIGWHLGRFLLSLLLASVCQNVLLLVGLKRVPWEGTEPGEYQLNTLSGGRSTLTEGNERSSLLEIDKSMLLAKGRTCSVCGNVEEDVTNWELLKKLDFHLLLWASCLGDSISFAILTNIGTFLYTTGHSHLTPVATIIAPIPMLLSKIISSTCSDYIHHALPRNAFVVLANLAHVTTLLLCVLWFREVPSIFALILISSLASGVRQSVTQTTVSELFGLTYFARNWSFLLFGVSVFTFIVQGVFGFLYGLEIAPGTGFLYCEVDNCFREIFIVQTALVSLATVVSAVFVVRHWRSDAF